MVKKEEYELSAEAQKEVTFVSGVVDTAKKTAIVAAHAVESTNGKYNPAKAEQFQNDLSRVAEQYENNVVALEQTRSDLETSRKQVVEHYGTSGKLRERVAKEVERSKTLEGKLEDAVNTVGELTTTRDAAISELNAAFSKYDNERRQREAYETQLTNVRETLMNVRTELDRVTIDHDSALKREGDLSSRANTRTSAVQTILETYFGVPESTFKGVAEDKKEEFVYKLLEEQLAERNAKDKKVEEELNSALGGNVKDDKAKETNGQKPVNRVKSTVRSGNGK